jgi:hypothetical protein
MECTGFPLAELPGLRSDPGNLSVILAVLGAGDGI